MTEDKDPRNGHRREFAAAVGRREVRKLRARKSAGKGVWFGLGMFGLVGWTVSIPVLIGIAIGVWIDARWPGPVSWTLVLLFLGVVVGCLNAWYWVSRERSRIEKDDNDDE
ncbi:MAG: AtpZ/AtpI family protein [Candidatus Aminicenantes bacterium]|nr:AtpZ/AtpI family protein [Candidatus Aminicenantes bacterium]